MSDAFALVHFVVASAIWLFLLTIVCVVAVGFMPKDHPLYELLTQLNKKLLVTLGLAAITVPVEFIPFVDIAWDLVAPIFVTYSWFGFVKDAIAADSPLRRKGSATLSRPIDARRAAARPLAIADEVVPARRAATEQEDFY